LQTKIDTMIKFFKFTAILEGFSYLILLANMLFIKPTDLVLYKTLLFPIGMTHGILFIAYLYLAFMIKEKQNWNTKELLIVILGSLIPFGAFFIERKYLKNA
jgi:integral membrane protein